MSKNKKVDYKNSPGLTEENIRKAAIEVFSKPPKTRQYKIYCSSKESLDAFKKAIGEKFNS